MKKRYLKIFSIHFIVILSFTILKEKFIGITYKFNLNPVVPLTWSEISENLVSYILFSFVLSLIMSYFLIYAVDEYKKQQIIDLEAARKRIKEKEKNDNEDESFFFLYSIKQHNCRSYTPILVVTIESLVVLRSA